jgi:tRNA U38,U39,U40 pseudouridine synthase TruA
MVSVGPEAQPCIAIELVGDRFLRRMVRVIVVSAFIKKILE